LIASELERSAKMPPKSKKEVKNIQKKVIEDKTFGLKNKNKSKVLNLPLSPHPSWPITFGGLAFCSAIPCWCHGGLLQTMPLKFSTCARHFDPFVCQMFFCV